jgi:phospholipid-binding lipoprotein MlaA
MMRWDMGLLSQGWSILRRGGVALAAVLLVGCASGPNANPADPLEGWNRGVYKFNDAVDRTVVKPVAVAYQDHVPSIVRKGVGNFFGNLEDIWTMVNSALQLKGQVATESFMRVSVNTVFGLLGLVDVASEMQIPRGNEDFGQTLGYWGVGPGPYLVLPVLGPSTLRDTVALPADWKGDLVAATSDATASYTGIVVRGVHKRANLLKQEGLMEGVALDKYSLLRDVYLQYRRNQVYDGDPPDEPSQEPMEPEADDAGKGAGASMLRPAEAVDLQAASSVVE